MSVPSSVAPPALGPAAATAPSGETATPAGVEVLIARLLTLGARAAVTLLAVGCVLMALAGISPLVPGWPPLDPAALVTQVLALEPEGFLWLGLIVTIATPLMRVVAATAGFARAGERAQVALGLGVLAVISLAVVAGMAGS